MHTPWKVAKPSASLSGLAWSGGGLKTTVGRVSRAGAMPLSQSLDTVGPLAQSAEDCALLLGLMADSNWWVRYRAAQALLGMPRMGADDVVQLSRTVGDRYARDMLDHVLAERGLTAQGLG